MIGKATAFLLALAIAHPAAAQTPTLAVVSAADYTNYPLAPGSLVSLFADNIAAGTTVAPDQVPSLPPLSLGGVSAAVTDSRGTTLPLPLIAVTQNQVNAVLPDAAAVGPATLALHTAGGATLSTTIQLQAVAPSLFTADQSGTWLAAAQVVVAHADGTRSFLPAIADCSGPLAWNGQTWSHCVPLLIDAGGDTDEAVLELFGTGIRGVSAVLARCAACGYAAVAANLPSSAGVPQPWNVEVLYAGPQGAGVPGSYYGLDQVNLALPHGLHGVVQLNLTVLAGYINGQGEGADTGFVTVVFK